MLTITHINYIRELYHVEGLRYSEIVKQTNCNYRTVKKYIEKEDYNENNHKVQRKKRSDSIRPIVREILLEDLERHPKQRHTATRIYARLSEEYPDKLKVSERTVRTVVKEEKQKVYGNKKAYLNLQHPGAEAQIDFGMVKVYEDGVLKKLHELVLSFPYSNARLLQITRSETRESLMEAMVDIFRHIGCVPRCIWFDQMAAAAIRKKDDKGKPEVTEQFLRFAMHHGFEVRFCNPNSGHEKGNVENSVGYLRRNLLVPEPRFTSLEDYNKSLLQRAATLMQKKHYQKEETIAELFEVEKEKCSPLPRVVFDTARYETRRVNKYGYIQYEKVTYSVSPKCVGEHVSLRVTATRIEIFTKDLQKKLCSHTRSYIKGSESIHWVDFIDVMKTRPRALKYSGIYGLLPTNWQTYLESCDNAELKESLGILRMIMLTDDLAFAKKVMDAADKHTAISSQSLYLAYRRLKENVNTFCGSMAVAKDLPPYQVSIDAYDSLIGCMCHE